MENEIDIQQQEKVPTLLVACNIGLVILVVAMASLIYDMTHRPKPATVTTTQDTTTHVFTDVALQAKAAYVFDMREHKAIFEKNKDMQLPLASLTKLMTALVATDLVPRDSHITIRKEFLEEEGDNGLRPGESWKLKDLLDFSLIVSSNDGARSLASVIGATHINTTDYDLGRKDFIAAMNERAKKLGMTQTYFLNESGLDETPTQSGAYGSAQDVADLLQYLISNRPQVLEATTYPATTISSQSENHTAKNTNIDIKEIPGLLASKTGYTALAGGNLAVAFDAGLEHPIVIVVLGSTQDGRFTDVDTLVKATMNYIQSVQ